MPAPSDQTPGDSPAFSDLALTAAVLKALQDVGYESPSPIQAATIPHLLAGTDVVGQAQTGTGKTAAFALPILSKIDVREPVTQALVLVPTRELAIQVAEAFQRYATHMKGFHVLPVYGGQSYTPQLHSLRRGAHVVVATPGRAMDHIKRGTLTLSSLKHLVLDEADEMLRMGFIDDVEWILEQAPAERQIALFSATMPAQVRRIAQHHLRSPAEVTIRSKTTTASAIRQRYWIVSGMHKLDALTRILEAEPFDAMLVFTRTKIATEDLAQRLAARGFAVEALNGDIVQAQRERTVARLKAGQIDIVVATDVAARGLDVERVSHVINFDIPYDPESYVHRIGRTGRAGRSGEAILFIAPRERNMLRVIERATRQPIEAMQLPSVEDVNERRVARFNEKITAAIASGAGQALLPLIVNYARDHDVPAAEIAAALASIVQGGTPLLMESARGPVEPRESPAPKPFERRPEKPVPGDKPRHKAAREERRDEPKRHEAGRQPPARQEPVHQEPVREQFREEFIGDDEPRREEPPRQEAKGEPLNRRERRAREHGGVSAAPRELNSESSEPKSASRSEPRAEPRSALRGEPRSELKTEFTRGPRREFGSDKGAPKRDFKRSDEDLETYRVEVGDQHGVKPANIVGAIANEVGLEGNRIGRVVIRDDHSFVDLPAGMPKEIFLKLQKVRVGGQQLQISRALKVHVEKLRRERPAAGAPKAPGAFKGTFKGAAKAPFKGAAKPPFKGSFKDKGKPAARRPR